ARRRTRAVAIDHHRGQSRAQARIEARRMSWLSRLANAFRPSSVDRALDEEAAFHLESRINELVAAGLSPKDADAQARRAFGNRLRLREESRDVKLLPGLVDCVQDVRVAV